MNAVNREITLHQNLVETLFANKNRVSQVFKDVLGLYDISHIAISHIDNHHQLRALSSTPSLEYNLFSSPLWKYDKTYHRSWYGLCTLSSWQSLYTPQYYDELYHMKQVKHAFPLGISFTIQQANAHYIYSIASNKDCPQTQEMFANQHEDFYKIGQYCSNLLLPVFHQAF